MVLSTTTRTSHISSIVNRSQGGGEKKAGFPYQVGRDTWTSIYLRPNSLPLYMLQQPDGVTKLVRRRYVRNVGLDMRIPGR